MVGEIGQENHAAYVASKGGLNALTNIVPPKNWTAS